MHSVSVVLAMVTADTVAMAVSAIIIFMLRKQLAMGKNC
jgi:hypothetical protein